MIASADATDTRGRRVTDLIILTIICSAMLIISWWGGTHHF